MNDEPYTNREITEFFREVKTQLDRIESQTTRTNGRVSKLENWRAYSTGATAMIVLIGLPVLAYLAVKVLI